MTTNWQDCTVVRDKDGVLITNPRADVYYCITLGEWDDMPGPITPVLDADGRPVVTTVGDLTARHVHMRVKVGGATAGMLRRLPQKYLDGWSVWIGDDFGVVPLEIVLQPDGLDTPCEVLP